MPALDDDAFEALEAALPPTPAPSGRAALAGDPFARLLKAALASAVAPRKLLAALEALRDAGFLEPSSLAGADPDELDDILRQAGAALPARSLGLARKLAGWVVRDHGGDAEALLDPATPTAQLRDELAGLNGVGPTTADTLLLFGLGRPAYPVDRPTFRIFVRHGWLDATSELDEARDAIERRAGGDPARLARLSAGLEQIGRDFCRATVAKCQRCPLRPLLPEGGPIEPGEG